MVSNIGIDMEDAGGAGEAEERPLSARSLLKREAILRGAAEVFLERGYLGTSVDEIAAAAGVSKQTVYRHFGDKKRLFTEMVTEMANRFGRPFLDVVNAARTRGVLKDALRAVGKTLLDVVMEPQILRLRRLVVAEVVRFPDLGRHYVAEGPSRGIDALADLFESYVERGVLKATDVRRAAAHFTWLVVAIPINRVMLLGESERPAPKELDMLIREAVDIFLAAYGGRAGSRPDRDERGPAS